MKKRSFQIRIIAMLLAVCGVAVCGVSCKDGNTSETNALVNQYAGGSEFAFGKWQGNSDIYTITAQNDGAYEIGWQKLMSSDANIPIVAEVAGNYTQFSYVNVTVSGTPDKEVAMRLGEKNSVTAAGLVNEVRFYTDTQPKTFTYKFTNRFATAGLKSIYLNPDAGSSGLQAIGSMTLHKCWFSTAVPEGAEYEDASRLKSYQFAAGRTWSRCNGWFVDTGWTNMRITPSSGGATRIRSTDEPASKFASVIYPIEPAATDTKFTLKFRNIDFSVETVTILLRGDRQSWNAGGYWDYWDVQTTHYGLTDANEIPQEGDDDTVTLSFDLAAARAALGNHIGEDGMTIVVFFDTFLNYPDSSTAQNRDRSFEVVVTDARCE